MSDCKSNITEKKFLAFLCALPAYNSSKAVVRLSFTILVCNSVFLSLLVFIVTVSSENENNNLGVIDFIHKAVLLCYMAAPLICTITTQLLGMAGTSTRMLSQFSFQLQQFLKGIRLGLLQLCSIKDGLLLILDLVRH